jgi:hypothetical protein
MEQHNNKPTNININKIKGMYNKKGKVKKMLTTGDAICNGIAVYHNGRLVADVYEDPQSHIIHVYAYKDAYGVSEVINHDLTT